MPVTVGTHGDAGLTPFQFQQVTVSSTVLALVIPGGSIPRRLVLGVHSGAIRVRWDGGTAKFDRGPSAAGEHGRGGYDAHGGADRRGGDYGLSHGPDGTTDAEVAYTIETEEVS